MGPQIRNRWLRITIYIAIIVLMVGHLAFLSHTWLQHVMDVTITLLAGARLWIEFHKES